MVNHGFGLHDLVGGIVDVAMGAGGGLVNSKLVRIFVKESNVVLSEEEWERLLKRTGSF